MCAHGLAEQVWFLWVFFVDGFLARFARHLFLVAELALVVGVLTRQVGRAFGVPLLFWNEVRWKQALAGLSVGLLTGKVLLIGFLLDRREPGDAAWLAALHPGGDVPVDVQLLHYFGGGLASLALTLAAGWTAAAAVRAWVAPVQARPFEGLRHPEGASSIAGASTGVPHLPLLAGLALGLALWTLALPPLIGRMAAVTPPALVDVLLRGELDPERRPVHLLAAMFFGGLAVSAVAAVVSRGTRFNTPATALCTLLGLAAAAYGFLAFRAPHPALAAGGLAALVAAGGLPTHKIRIAALRELYRPDRRVRSYPAPCLAPPPLIPLEEARERWTTRSPLVVVCASGGGIRAAVWTAAVLCELERRIPELPYHVRLIAGASGGMVGAAYYTATLIHPSLAAATGCAHDLLDRGERAAGAGPVLDELVRRLAADALSPVLKTGLLHDLPLALLPAPAVYEHRGHELERALRRNLGGAFARSFGDLASGEAQGWRPSLVFAPVLVEDGRRLLISNLDLEALTLNTGPRLCGERSYSRSAYQFARMFPGAWPDLPLSTAAVLSAAFPLVTPSPVLPTEPRLRVADAGYYDVYGVDLAASVLLDQAAWLERNVSGILLVEIRDEIDHRSLVQPGLAPHHPAARADWAWSDTPLGRGLEELVTPVTGLLSAGAAVPLFRNDRELQRLGERFPPGFLETIQFTFDGEASLSWYVTAAETRALVERAAADRPVHDALVCWWNERRAISPGRARGLRVLEIPDRFRPFQVDPAGGAS